MNVPKDELWPSKTPTKIVGKISNVYEDPDHVKMPMRFNMGNTHLFDKVAAKTGAECTGAALTRSATSVEPRP